MSNLSNLSRYLTFALLLCACGRESPSVPEDFPWDLTVDVSITGSNGEVFRVIQPGEPEWDDYVAMSQEKQLASYLDGRPGYAMPYDPEWRSMVLGYRNAARSEMPLQNSFASMDELAQQVLAWIGTQDLAALSGAVINQSEFSQLCWPSYPQSRPYVRIPWTEAWAFQHAENRGGASILLRDFGGQPLRLERIEVSAVREYPPNFRLHDQVKLHVWNADTQERAVLTNLVSILEKDGVFKPYMFND